MTYQRNMECDLEAEEDVFDETGEREVGYPEVGAHDRDGDDDDDGRGEKLAPAGPFDLLQLAGGLAGESSEAAAALSPRSRLALRLADRLDLAPARASAVRSACGLLELGAATRAGAIAGHQRVSRCTVCEPHQRQYFFASKRSGVLRFDFWVW
jgi:hypothetical protein